MLPWHRLPYLLLVCYVLLSTYIECKKRKDKNKNWCLTRAVTRTIPALSYRLFNKLANSIIYRFLHYVRPSRAGFIITKYQITC